MEIFCERMNNIGIKIKYYNENALHVKQQKILNIPGMY